MRLLQQPVLSHFFTKKRAKNGTKHFNLVPAGFGRVGGELLPQAREFKYLGVLFTSDGKIEQEIDRRIGGSVCGVAGAVNLPASMLQPSRML